jgi:hypothetical protein
VQTDEEDRETDIYFREYGAVDAGYAFQQSGSPGGVLEINPGYSIAGKSRTGIQLGYMGYDETSMAPPSLAWIIIW